MSLTTPARVGVIPLSEEQARTEALFDRLFPICRSILGPGYRESLAILREWIPLETESIPSGTRLFDWTVPKEWRIRNARLTGPGGKIYADFKRTNLSVVNYSAPVDRKFSLQELRPHLHSLPDLPDAVPYVTSYYRHEWGFCLSDRVLATLPEGEYHAQIDAEHVDGSLEFAQCVLPGETNREILLSSYLCHPSLANNELSGPLVLVLLYQRLLCWKRRRFTYRFLINPETIGSLALLSRHGEYLRGKLAAGLVLTCLGGPEASLSYKTTRREEAWLDRLVLHLQEWKHLEVRIRPFTPVGGSDERQYNSPGFNLPVGQMARTVYREYPGYHNSLDDKAFMGIAPLIDSAARIEQLLRAAEIAGRFLNRSPHGEVHLATHGLYPAMNRDGNRQFADNSPEGPARLLKHLLMILNYSDGRRDMLEIARRCGCSLFDLEPAIRTLEERGLLALQAEGESPE